LVSGEHYRVAIKLSRVQQRRLGTTDTQNTTRLHTVRGHFKIRKTGIFWWPHFMRGDPQKGAITKDYTVVK